LCPGARVATVAEPRTKPITLLAGASDFMSDLHSDPGPGRTYLAFAVCTLVWGSTFLFIRLGNDSVPPMWGATLRLTLAAIILMGIVFGRGRRLPSGPALRAAAWFGLFQFGVNFPLLYWAEMFLPSGLAAVVFATIPITAALVATAFGLERLVPLKLAGALVAIGGVAILFADQLAARVTVLPLLSIFLATVFAALGSTLLKRGPRQDPLAANAVGAVVGAPVCLLASVLLRESRALPTTWGQLYPVVYLAVFGSVVAFVVFAWLVNHQNVSSVAFIGVVVPVIAVALGALVRNETVSREHIAGSILVLAGVVLAIRSDRRRPARPRLRES